MLFRSPIVAERYLTGRGRKDLEIWKPTRRVRSTAPGGVLRIQVPAAFRLRWTIDEWQTFKDSPSSSVGLGTHFMDIHVPAQQRAPVRFTFFWPEAQRWEGRNYQVEVLAL